MRKLIGQIVSDKMQKTVVVAVTFMKEHPKYRKTYKVTRRFKAHDELGEFHTGDMVVIQATRPLSREKRWKVVEKVTALASVPALEKMKNADDIFTEVKPDLENQ